VMLSLAHDLHSSSIGKKIVEHQLCARGSFVLDTARY